MYKFGTWVPMGIFLITDVPDSVFFLLLADMKKTENLAVKAARKNYKYN